MEFAQKETRFAENRLTLLQWGVVAVFLFLASGFWRLQILQSNYYTRLAERNHIKQLPIPAPRGRILDRHARVLVDNSPSFSILAQWGEKKKLQEHLPALAEGLGIDLAELQQQVEKFKRRAPYQPIVIRENAAWRQVAFLESHRSEFPELDLVVAQRRLYPSQGFAAHLLGYVGEVSESDLDLPELALSQPGDLVGKAGIERQYNAVVQGEDGVRRVVVDSRGLDVAVLDEKPPRPGRDLRLTIDEDLQQVAEEGFREEVGAVVALDPRTGEVLALLSRPTFDPNLFTTGISRENWSKLTTDQDNPLLNRSIQAQLAPGSVHKILLGTAALEAGTADANTTYYCPGGAVFYGRYFQCWIKHGHGRVNLHQAIVQSCDVFFYNLGKTLGIERMAEYSVRLGLGQKTGIDLPNEESGTVPSPAWKERVFRQKWYPGETISVSIGQGALTVTPLQLAYSIGGIASEGFFARPHLVFSEEVKAAGRKVAAPAAVRVSLQEETVAMISDALYGVVNEGGTGGRARIPGLDVGGKTGTAQVASVQMVRSAKGATHLRDNGWFVGLAPRRNPEIVVAVLYQGGEHGALAAPLARDIIKTYFDKKKEVQPHLAQTPESNQQATVGPVPADSGG
ncbi:MAG: penicillin-binding protein 2 [Acidobacteria bacterium RIFCSPLOWO2_12_FULL_59_11]|nr:MAG: penicillin-binding protein 2 [Acidobacteria bacterium RIFCSPLOWO2_12_FULL_59_11]